MELYRLDAADLDAAECRFLQARFPRRWARAARCLRLEDRRSILAAGALLHRVLGLEDEAQLCLDPAGRPFLPGGPSFSLSHSGGRCVLALGRGRLGVDLERLEPDNLPAAEAALRPEELVWIRPAPLERFHILWTRKESLYKALGGYEDPKQIPALGPPWPEGLFVKSTVRAGFALSLCGEEDPGELSPVVLT